MAESFVQYPDDAANTGPKLRTAQKTVGADTVDEPAHVLSDPTTTNQARVLDANPAPTDAALVTRPINGSGTNALSIQDGGNSITVDGPLTDTQLRASAFAVTANAGSGTFAVSGPLTDTQLRATAVPVSGPLTDTQLRATAVPVSGPLTDTQLRASSFAVTLAAGSAAFGKLAANSGVDIGDVDVTTMPATFAEDSAHADAHTGVFVLAVRRDTAAVGSSTDGDYSSLNVDNAGLLRTRLDGIGATYTGRDSGAAARPGEHLRANLASWTGWDLDSIGGIATTGVNGLRSLGVGVILYNGATFDTWKGDTTNGADVDVTRLPTLTKGTQGATGASVQALKDAGRTILNYLMVAPVTLTTTDTAQSLTGYSNGASITAATATASTAIAAGLRWRLTSLSIEYSGSNTAGGVLVTLRANTSGAAVPTSPALGAWLIGSGIGGFCAISVPLVDGVELPSGSSIVITAQGRGTNNAAAALGYVRTGVNGYTY